MTIEELIADTRRRYEGMRGIDLPRRRLLQFAAILDQRVAKVRLPFHYSIWLVKGW